MGLRNSMDCPLRKAVVVFSGVRLREVFMNEADKPNARDYAGESLSAVEAVNVSDFGLEV